MGFRHYRNLGTKDPVQNTSKIGEEYWEERGSIEHFNQIVAINQDGRYEVQMLWNENHSPLLTNTNIEKKDWRIILIKAQTKEFLWRVWQHPERMENITEEVSRNEWNEKLFYFWGEYISDDYLYKGHYLPHRTVYKEN